MRLDCTVEAIVSLVEAPTSEPQVIDGPSFPSSCPAGNCDFCTTVACPSRFLKVLQISAVPACFLLAHTVSACFRTPVTPAGL